MALSKCPRLEICHPNTDSGVDDEKRVVGVVLLCLYLSREPAVIEPQHRYAHPYLIVYHCFSLA